MEMPRPATPPVELFSSTTPPAPAQAAALALRMPALAGSGLEPPRFHETGWHVGQTFRARDDPDRTQEHWEPPRFVCERDPQLQHPELDPEELAVPNAAPARRFARVVRGVLWEQDCAELITRVNAKGFTPALLNVGVDKQELRPHVRDGHRVIVDSKELADWLLRVLIPHLPETLDDGSQLVELNERLRFLCYTPGQSFDEHLDGKYRRPHGHPRQGDSSRITVQLYLHNVPEAFGGATTFFPGRASSVKHQPEAGSVLLFTQDLPHEGSVVTEGIKYTLRTEVMYARPRPNETSKLKQG